MAITNLFLVDNITHGVPSGNYDGSSLEFDTDGVKGVGYYPGQGNLQNLGIRTTGFSGTVTIQATLDDDWTDANWVDTFVYDAGAITPISGYRPESLVGNYTWLRAHITDFTAGTINFILVSY